MIDNKNTYFRYFSVLVHARSACKLFARRGDYPDKEIHRILESFHPDIIRFSFEQNVLITVGVTTLIIYIYMLLYVLR